MTLQDYLKRPGALSRSQLCEGLGVTNARLSQLNGKPWPPHLALKMEKLTCGAVCASDLSPIVKDARAA